MKAFQEIFRLNRHIALACSRPERLYLIQSSILGLQTIRSYHSSFPRLKLVVENVPALGESITEGSIGKWLKQPGDKVAVDDVIVVVETDKVTVDIKSIYNGVLTKHLSNDKVFVGAPLYEIDADASVSSAVAAPSVKEAPAPSQQKTEVAETKADHAHAHHPSIKFVGKRSKVQSKPAIQPTITATASPPASAASSSATEVQPAKATPTFPNVKAPKPTGRAVDFATLKDGAFYGRPKLSPKEMEAIESGGAF